MTKANSTAVAPCSQTRKRRARPRVIVYSSRIQLVAEIEDMRRRPKVGAQTAWKTCNTTNLLPATQNCTTSNGAAANLNAAVTTAIQSTSLGTLATLASGYPAEGYYCVNSSGALESVGKQADCWLRVRPGSDRDNSCRDHRFASTETAQMLYRCALLIGVVTGLDGCAPQMDLPHPAAARSKAAMSSLIILLMAAKTRAETFRSGSARRRGRASGTSHAASPP